MISKAIQSFDWDATFLDKSTEEKASVLTKTILNIMSNFIPNEMNILRIVSNQIILNHFEQMQDTLRTSIEISKQNYYFKLSMKLAVNKINPKCYWSILKSFLCNKKIPCVPPLIHNNQLFVDFKKKRELFNLFLTKQCTHIETRSNLPT